MFRSWNRPQWRMLAATVLAATTVAAGEAGGPFGNPFRQETSLERLAKTLDKVEREFQYTGRVVVKAPDVWGQARLMKHREEFEDEMSDQRTKFSPMLGAEIAVSDQAFLSQALTLAAATQGRAFPANNQSPNLPQLTLTTIDTLNRLTPAPGGEAIQRQLNTSLRLSVDPTFQPSMISIEPEIILDQQKRYLDHLHEIRRINEGDDTSDSPGYSLNLVRVPVSLLPGDHTRQNYGAEITFIAEPVVTEELLAPTFRELVINDLIDQLALPILKIIDKGWDGLHKADQLISLLQYAKTQETNEGSAAASKSLDGGKGENIPPQPDDNGGAAAAATQPMRFDQIEVDGATQSQPIQMYLSSGLVDRQLIMDDVIERFRDAIAKNAVGVSESAVDMKEPREFARVALLELERTAHDIQVLISRDRRSRYPVAPSQLGNTFGAYELVIMALGAFRARDQWQCRDRASLADIQGLLRNELEYAYDYLGDVRINILDSQVGSAECHGVWDTWLVPTADEVRRPDECIKKRQAFFQALPLPPDAIILRQGNNPDSRPVKGSKLTESLGWAILVESSLLSDHLNEDMQHVSQDPNCGCTFGGPHTFYGPNPPPEARQAFVQYVKCRWPIRVFALDPVTQQQNVADTFSLRRESQLAIALAFSKGLVNTNSLTRYMRRIEQDLRTISLNNTHVGFGAGDDIFGWRFYPRVQTPDVESNLKTIGRDLIWGGPNRDARLKTWRIEPGMRECVALMVMPSFIKHVRFDVRTNWIRLVPGVGTELFKKGENGITLKYAMDWSRDLQSIENDMLACIKDEHLYLPGEAQRLVKRAQQLSRQMPITTMHAQVPYENTLGGFEMFASGVTDLAPELVGFYGAPGVDTTRGTTLFLVGDNFSVHQTEVIVGNLHISDKKMLSREVIQITIPDGARIERRRCQPSDAFLPCPGTGDCTDEYVEVRLATPYGVSSPLFVPVVKAPNSGTPTPGPPSVSGISAAPGISSSNMARSSFFISGENFVENQTSVIVGNQAIGSGDLRFVSNKTLMATVTAPVNGTGDKQDVAEVVVATPHGVSAPQGIRLIGAAEESADATRKQIESALQQHFDDQHLDRWTLRADPTSLTLNLTIGQLNIPGSVELSNPMATVTVVATDPLDPSVHTIFGTRTGGLSGLLAGWWIAKSSDKAIADQKVAVGPWEFEEGKALPLAGIINKDDKLRKFLLDLEARHFQIQEIQFVGFVRIPNGRDTPTLRLKDPIKFAIYSTIPSAPAPLN